MRARHAFAALAVALLVVALLAPGSSTDAVAVVDAATPVETPDVIRVVHVERTPPPLPTPPPRKPRRPPKPRTPGLPAQRAAVMPSANAIARGQMLLEEGRFPRLRASYSHIGFERYRDAVTALGAGFYLFDPAERRLLAQVDPVTGESVERATPGDLSHWPRDVSRHLEAALRAGRERYGERAGRVVLLPPVSVDASLLGALDQALRAQSLDARDLVRVDLVYELRGGRLHCDVLAIALRDGSERSLDLLIDLSGRIAS